ncbi:hypothetical protein PIB30_014161 [Stylosanthes scabra]|uniref:Uncharacterized protein n=1 Tax=Stylosanthes scabra TaxID=79078 RepID=A0ABU6U5L5_9FABA|nr:hypothetical protein [Stylosanthes scabra]
MVKDGRRSNERAEEGRWWKMEAAPHTMVTTTPSRTRVFSLACKTDSDDFCLKRCGGDEIEATLHLPLPVVLPLSLFILQQRRRDGDMTATRHGADKGSFNGVSAFLPLFVSLSLCPLLRLSLHDDGATTFLPF